MRNLKKNWYLVAIIAATVILAVIAVITAIRLYQIGKEPVAPTAPKPAPAAAPACQLTFSLATPTPTTPTPTDTTPTPPTPTPIPECWESCIDDADCPEDLVCSDVEGNDLCVNPDCAIEDQWGTCVCLEETPTPTETESPTPTPTGTSIPEATPTPTSTSAPGATPTPTPTTPPSCWNVCTDDSGCAGSLVCQSVSGVNRCVNASCPTETDCICALPTTPTPTAVAQVELPEAGFALPTVGAILGGLLLIVTSLLIIF